MFPKDNQNQPEEGQSAFRAALAKKRQSMHVPARKYSDFDAESQKGSGTRSKKSSVGQSDANDKKNFRRTLLRLETVVPRGSKMLGTFYNPLMRKDSMDSVDSSNISRDETPDVSPRSGAKLATRPSISTFSLFHQKTNLTPRKSSLAPINTSTEPSDDKFFFRIKSPNSNSLANYPFLSHRGSDAMSVKSPSYASRILVTSPTEMSNQPEKPKKFYSTYRKKIVLKEETVINKPVSSTISVDHLNIKEKIQFITTSTETSVRSTTTTMRNLHEFLELIQNMAQLMNASLDSFKQVQSSVVEIENVIMLLNKHPTKDSIVKICNWVHLSRCNEYNLKALIEAGNLEGFGAYAEKSFDDVRINYLVLFLMSYIEDFEKLLNISKQKITQEASIREKDVIPRTIRQADLICHCISEMLIDDFRSKKTYLLAECRDLVNGFRYSNTRIRSSYTAIREKVEESLEILKMLYHKIKNYEKKMDGYHERQKELKENLDFLKSESKSLGRLLQDIQPIEQNIKMFSGKFTQGIETLKKVLSFKLKVENVETLFQMPEISKKLTDYLDWLGSYFSRGSQPTNSQIIEMYNDLMRIPPIKASFSLFVSYFQDLLKSKIYHELFSESFSQLKAINDNVNELYANVDEQFESFVKNNFDSLIKVANKHKRIMKNEPWKILTWSDFSNNQNLENSITKITTAVKIIRESLDKSRLLRQHNYKDAIEKSESVEENMKAWNEEIRFTENLLEYLRTITSEVHVPFYKFNADYENSKPIKARFDGLVGVYIKLRNNHNFAMICKNVGEHLRGRQYYNERQDTLRDFEDSMLRFHLELFFKIFFKKLHIEFKKYFTNMLIVIPSDKFSKFKQFVTSFIEILDDLCAQPSIARLPQVCNLFQRRCEDLEMVTAMMEQILLINEKKPKSLTSSDEANIRSAPQATLFKYLLESIHSYEALHGKLNVSYRANELESQMQKLEEEVEKNDFDQEDLQHCLDQLEKRVKITLEEVHGHSPADVERGSGKKREQSTVKTMINDILSRILKLRRKIVKVATQKHLNQLQLLQDECKKIINTSLQNRIDCYDIKVHKPSVDTLRGKIEDFKNSRENSGDKEVIEEIINDMDENLTTLELIALTGEKLEITITGKLENLDQVSVCIEALKVLKEELAAKIREVDISNADMRACTLEQLRNIEIIEDYLSNAYEGLIQINQEVFKDERLYDDIRLTLSECFEIHFLAHPSFKDKIYSPDLETIKSEIEVIRGGIENLKQLLRLDNLALDETVAFSYEQASLLEGWLPEEMLSLFADLVKITRLYGFMMSLTESLTDSIISGESIKFTESFEKLNQAQELYASLQEHEEVLQKTLGQIDEADILLGKLKLIDAQIGLATVIIKVGKIANDLQDSRDLDMQFDMISERKSISSIRRSLLTSLKSEMQNYHKDIKKNAKGYMSFEEYQTVTDLQLTFELFASDIEADLTKGSCHALGDLENEFLLKLNPEKIGARSTLKDSQMFSKLLREIRSTLRRKANFDPTIGAKFQVDMIFPTIYKTSKGNLVAVLDIVSKGQMNFKGIILSIIKEDVKKIQELTEDIVDDLNINFKLPDLIINT